MPWLIVLNPGEDPSKLPDWAREARGNEFCLAALSARRRASDVGARLFPAPSIEPCHC